MSNNEINRDGNETQEYDYSYFISNAGQRYFKQNYNYPNQNGRKDNTALLPPKAVIPTIHCFRVYEPNRCEYVNYYLPDIDIPIEEIKLNFLEQVVL